MKKKTIVICSSASFYEKLFDIQKILRKRGFKVVLPITAYRMKRNKNFDVNFYKTWIKNPDDYSKKREYIDLHFKKIIKGDAILVANFDKKGVKGYIGGNVLMEMTIAYYFKKPIFILNPIANDSPIQEEIYGINSIFIDGDLASISL
jgi:hypothetical protein